MKPGNKSEIVLKLEKLLAVKLILFVLFQVNLLFIETLPFLKYSDTVTNI